MEAQVEGKVVVSVRKPSKLGPIITFSGPTGSCKTALSLETVQLLRSRGWKVRLFKSYPLAFHAREPLSERVDKIGESLAKVSTKGSQPNFFLRLFARFIFIAELLLVQMAIRAYRGAGVALVFDRYAYDALVQLRVSGMCGDTFVRWLTKLISVPDAPFFLRIKPETGHTRRPDYSLEEFSLANSVYEQIAQRVHFWVVDTENEKRAREEVRGIIAYLEREW